jgi:hypothetical protein
MTNAQKAWQKTRVIQSCAGGQDRRLRETLTGIEHAPSGRAKTNGNADAPSGHASSAANLLGRCRY